MHARRYYYKALESDVGRMGPALWFIAELYKVEDRAAAMTAADRLCLRQIDNNATERDIRGVAVGRNNWMFFGSDRGGEIAAILRSFTASCQRVGVEPFAWFKDVLSRIATHPINRIAELLPHNWKPALA